MATARVVSRPTEQLGDAELVAASSDDPEAFGELFHRHAPRLHAYVKRRLGRTLADDIVAETFATAFRQRGKFDGRAEFAAWLWGIASNSIAKHHRQETRMFRAFARTGVDPAEDGIADLVSDRVTATAQGPHLAKALAALNSQDRSALLLLAWGELSYAEIAAVLNLPLGTVKAKIHRARTKLRKALLRENDHG
ncbi:MULTISPECIES: RNA polymerase sigma factor [Nonomuraea]|uniref:RNA polymerase sigma factor n=1 Tax=Nonomuraea salmonea TaxID=46181 RepID=A0ABV5P3G5_9ACTN